MTENYLKEHFKDCTIYDSLTNGKPTDGICTCGYGFRVLQESKMDSEMYSRARRVRMEKDSRLERVMRVPSDSADALLRADAAK